MVRIIGEIDCLGTSNKRIPCSMFVRAKDVLILEAKEHSRAYVNIHNQDVLTVYMTSDDAWSASRDQTKETRLSSDPY